MALIQCGECGKPMSDAAKTCPACGAPRPGASERNITWLFWGGLAALALGAVAWNATRTSPEEQAARNAYHALCDDMNAHGAQRIAECVDLGAAFIQKFGSQP